VAEGRVSAALSLCRTPTITSIPSARNWASLPGHPVDPPDSAIATTYPARSRRRSRLTAGGVRPWWQRAPASPTERCPRRRPFNTRLDQGTPSAVGAPRPLGVEASSTQRVHRGQHHLLPKPAIGAGAGLRRAPRHARARSIPALNRRSRVLLPLSALDITVVAHQASRREREICPWQESHGYVVFTRPPHDAAQTFQADRDYKLETPSIAPFPDHIGGNRQLVNGTGSFQAQRRSWERSATMLKIRIPPRRVGQCKPPRLGMLQGEGRPSSSEGAERTCTGWGASSRNLPAGSATRPDAKRPPSWALAVSHQLPALVGEVTQLSGCAQQRASRGIGGACSWAKGPEAPITCVWGNDEPGQQTTATGAKQIRIRDGKPRAPIGPWIQCSFYIGMVRLPLLMFPAARPIGCSSVCVPARRARRSPSPAGSGRRGGWPAAVIASGVRKLQAAAIHLVHQPRC